MKSYYKSLALMALVSLNTQAMDYKKIAAYIAGGVTVAVSIAQLGYYIYIPVNQFILKPRKEVAQILQASTIASNQGRKLEYMIYDSTTEEQIKESAATLRATKQAIQQKEGIDCDSFLFKGPPGTGKTSGVMALAKAAGLPVVIVTPNSLFHNNKAGGIETINTIKKQYGSKPFILCIDEFHTTDAFIDTLKALTGTPSKTMVLTATTNEEKIDPSILRRFTHCISMQLPNAQTREKAINIFKKEHGLEGSDNKWAKEWTPEFTQKVVQASQGLSQAEISDSFRTARKKILISADQQFKQDYILNAIKQSVLKKNNLQEPTESKAMTATAA